MADQSVPRKNQIYVLDTTLVSQADANIMQDPPTLAVGDVQVSTDGGALANAINAPVTNPVGSKIAEVTLTAGEMNGDIVVVCWSDAAGAEWQDQTWVLHPTDNPLSSVGIAAGAITTVTFGAGAIDAAALAADAAQEIADTTLGRDFASVAVIAARSLLNAGRFSRNRWQIAGGILTVYEEDDVTVAWTGAVSTAVSDPVVEIDPT